MIADGKYEEFEKLVLEGKASLEDLSEEMFQKFKEWIEGYAVLSFTVSDN